MANFVVLLIRIIWKIFPVERTDCLRQLATHCDLDFLPLAYAQRGILKSQNDDSGEKFFVKDVLVSCLNPEICVLDVGANSGEYSRLIHSYFPHAKIFSFEPNPALITGLTKSIGHFASVIPIAVGSDDGEITLHNSTLPGRAAHGSVHSNVLSTLHRYEKIESVSVPMRSLSSFFRDHVPGVVDLLKIDTEGHELEVLKGCQDDLKNGKVRLIQFEFNEMNIVSRAFLLDFFKLLPTFDFFRLDTTALHRLTYHPREEIFQFQNIIAVLNTDPVAELLKSRFARGE